MDIAEIYEKFAQIDCLTFATIDRNYPQTRIAHLFAYGHEGLNFRTMITKAISQHDEQFLIDNTRCDVCGDCYTICPANAVEIVIDDPAN